MDQADGTSGEQPWLHQLVVVVDGPATALSPISGQFEVMGTQGFFVDDERAVSILTRRLGSDPLTPISASARGADAEFYSAARTLGDQGPDPTVELEHRRSVDGASMTETFLVHNRSGVRMDQPLVISCAGDGADISIVKAGAAPQSVLPVDLDPGGVVSWRTATQQVQVVCDPEPSSTDAAPGGEALLRFDLDIAPGASATVTVRITTRRTATSLFDSDAGSRSVGWAGGIQVRAGDPRLERLAATGVLDLQHLLLRDPLAPADVFAAAGTPWYLTLFGRDALWTARLALPLGTTLAAGTLRALARRQGTRTDRSTAEQPGKIAHEVRRSAAGGLPPLYYGTVDATALWILLLADARRWGLPDDDAQELLPTLRAATGWLLDQAAANEDGLIRYVDESGGGLVNQGWKDSSDAIRFRNGTLGEPPIALLEVQAYAVEAGRAAASLLEELSPADAPLAGRARTAADGWEAAVRDRFWTAGEDPYLGIAIDGDGALVDGIASNMGHALGTSALTAREAALVSDRLMAPNMLGQFGVRTLAADNGGFNPIGYHTGSVWTHDTAICALGLMKEGHREAAAELAARLVAAAAAFNYRSPELHGDATPLGRPLPYPAACRPQAWAAASAVTVLQLAIGLQVDVPNRRVDLNPPRSMPFGPLRIEGLQIGGYAVSVEVFADGSCALQGLPSDFEILTIGAEGDHL
ncbi:glycogen debranching N-terminal domain-containing protein [Branchiibius sp. NY16-3462-2]|uniref:glycogen debranching N-terminal domain-containing protein n=1 Tax=Branchiibius sp. NY16-3462-2 TaxID=1807500 RepID=UPI0025C6F4D3|nr:glycogen debranching N-terminal domain-containing protein [Branchiibius sp. NY16-3462-2]